MIVKLDREGRLDMECSGNVTHSCTDPNIPEREAISKLETLWSGYTRPTSFTVNDIDALAFLHLNVINTLFACVTCE